MIRVLWLKGKQAGWRSGLQRNHAALAVASGQAGESCPSRRRGRGSMEGCRDYGCIAIIASGGDHRRSLSRSEGEVFDFDE